jgi:predicted dienelactone hydrolase
MRNRLFQDSKFRRTLVSGTLLTALTLASSAFAAVGFREAQAADEGSKPLSIFLWYPTEANAAPMRAGSGFQNVAVNGPIKGNNLPLIVPSHGSSSSPFNHIDLAMALAEAGFVVAAPVHTGDNYADSSDAGFRRALLNRPRHMIIAINYVLQQWPEHTRMDRGRIGVSGFSLGGLTALTVAGGTPEFSRIVRVPVQLWRGSADENVPDEWNTALVRRELPTPPEEHVVPNAGHFVFMTACNETLAKQAPEICIDPPGVDRVAFYRNFNRAVVAFFRTHVARG